jgi:bifunctional DNA-binding transcriptional regulator/antitoxin component of YhaV-PrlF toxin-antitoxin module
MAARMQPEIPSHPYRLKVDLAGRVVIPAEIRHSMKVIPGRELFAELDQEGVLRLRTLEQIVAHLQDCYTPLKSGGSVSAELIQERRDEAERE